MDSSNLSGGYNIYRIQIMSDYMTNEMCPKCFKQMEFKEYLSQCDEVNFFKLFQCPECKNVEVKR